MLQTFQAEDNTFFKKQNVIYLWKIQFTANTAFLEAWFNNHSVIFYIFDGS